MRRRESVVNLQRPRGRRLGFGRGFLRWNEREVVVREVDVQRGHPRVGGRVIRVGADRLLEISVEISSWIARISGSFRVYRSPHRWRLLRTSTSSVLITRSLPRCATV